MRTSHIFNADGVRLEADEFVLSDFFCNHPWCKIGENLMDWLRLGSNDSWPCSYLSMWTSPGLNVGSNLLLKCALLIERALKLNRGFKPSTSSSSSSSSKSSR